MGNGMGAGSGRWALARCGQGALGEERGRPTWARCRQVKKRLNLTKAVVSLLAVSGWPAGSQPAWANKNGQGQRGSVTKEHSNINQERERGGRPFGRLNGADAAGTAAIYLLYSD